MTTTTTQATTTTTHDANHAARVRVELTRMRRAASARRRRDAARHGEPITADEIAQLRDDALAASC